MFFFGFFFGLCVFLNDIEILKTVSDWLGKPMILLQIFAELHVSGYENLIHIPCRCGSKQAGNHEFESKLL